MKKMMLLILVLWLPSPLLAAETKEESDPFDWNSVQQELKEESQGQGHLDAGSIDRLLRALELKNEISEREMRFAMSKLESEFWYVITLSVMCVVSLVTALAFLVRRQSYTPKDMVNVIGLTLIIYSTIILVLVVSTSEQLTAAIGILGAIAGYLFRSAQESVRERGERGSG